MRAWWPALFVALLLSTPGCSPSRSKDKTPPKEPPRKDQPNPFAAGGAETGEGRGEQLSLVPERRSPIQVTMDGQKMVASVGGDFWRIPKPVSSTPSMVFTTKLNPFGRAQIFIWPCNEKGEDSGERSIAVTDLTRRTLVPGRPFSLAKPAGCVILGQGTLASVPLESGKTYRMTLRVEGEGGKEERVSVVFSVR